jgi:predicted ATPase
MLAGEPPFRSSDPLELVHAHLARRPRPLAEASPELPEPIARIVDKLLEKQPEDRYQHVSALAFDLRSCRDSLEKHGSIPCDLVLNSADAPSRPLFRLRLYGRERETHRIQSMYERVAAAEETELLLISGAPGVGKSSLLEALRAQVSEKRGYLAAGKYDLYRRSSPYSGLLLAFEHLIQQILTESGERLDRWRHVLREALGNVAPALIEVVPDLVHVLGEMPPAPRLGPEETRQRLGLAVSRFVSGIACAERPLVLFLDDLQWAEPGSLYLLEQILLDRQVKSLLIVGTYRANELENVHALSALMGRLRDIGVPVHEVTLGPLPPSACAALLADVLGRSADEVSWLSERVQLKTGSIPFLVQQFVYRMCDRGVIRFEPGSGWAWDSERLAAADVSDDAASVMSERLSELPEAPLRLVKLASCVGSVFDSAQLAMLTAHPATSVDLPLGKLADEGLIAPCSQGFRFVHDRVREAAQALCSDAERACFHAEIGWALHATHAASDGEQAVAICDHLNRARELLTPDQRWPLLKCNVVAGTFALRAGAPRTARTYFDTAAALFEDSDWSRDPATGWELCYGRVDCVGLSGDYPLALRLLQELESRPLSLIQASVAAFRRIGIYAVIDPVRAADVALVSLARFGVRFPREPSWLRLRTSQWLTDRSLRRRTDRGIFRPADKLPEQWLAVYLQLGGAAGAMIRHRTRLTLLVVAWLVRKYAKFGYYRAPAFALGGYAHLRLLVARDWETSRRYGEVALQLRDSASDPVTWPKAAVQIYGVLEPWFVPRRAVVAPLRRTFDEALEVGDSEYAYYSAYLCASYQALSGVALEEVLSELKRLGEFARRWSSMSAERAAALLALYRLLVHPPAGALSDQLKPILEPLAEWDRAAMAPHVLLALLVCSQFEAAFQEAQRMEQRIDDCTGSSPATADFHLLRGIAAAELAASAPVRSSRRRYRATLRASYSKVRLYARRGPDYVHYRQMLEAECARLAGKSSQALALYDQAARRAEQQQYPHHAGLARERRAGLLIHLRQHSSAVLDLRRARTAYERWGCARKLAQMDEHTE